MPIIGPHIGAILGAIAYIGLVEFHWPKGQETDMSGNEIPKDPTYTLLLILIFILILLLIFIIILILLLLVTEKQKPN